MRYDFLYVIWCQLRNRSYEVKLYVILSGILENNRKELYKTPDRKQNCLGSNSMEGISLNCLRQKLDKSLYDNKSD